MTGIGDRWTPVGGKPTDSSMGPNRALAIVHIPKTPDEQLAAERRRQAWECHEAAVTLAGRARDRADLVMLLQMCGLLGYDAEPVRDGASRDRDYRARLKAAR